MTGVVYLHYLDLTPLIFVLLYGDMANRNTRRKRKLGMEEGGQTFKGEPCVTSFKDRLKKNLPISRQKNYSSSAKIKSHDPILDSVELL